MVEIVDGERFLEPGTSILLQLDDGRPFPCCVKSGDEFAGRYTLLPTDDRNRRDATANR